MKKYIKNGVIITEGTSITFDGRFIINPREIDYASAGWEEYEEPEENLLAEAIASKINEIEAYDASDSVNGFTYGGNTLWFDAATRASYKSSIDSAELLGETELTIPTTAGAITLPLETAKVMLAKIQRYADACYLVTQNHLATVKQKEDVESVEAYDYTVGYPSRLEFTA